MSEFTYNEMENAENKGGFLSRFFNSIVQPLRDFSAKVEAWASETRTEYENPNAPDYSQNEHIARRVLQRGANVEDSQELQTAVEAYLKQSFAHDINPADIVREIENMPAETVQALQPSAEVMADLKATQERQAAQQAQIDEYTDFFDKLSQATGREFWDDEELRQTYRDVEAELGGLDANDDEIIKQTAARLNEKAPQPEGPQVG